MCAIIMIVSSLSNFTSDLLSAIQLAYSIAEEIPSSIFTWLVYEFIVNEMWFKRLWSFRVKYKEAKLSTKACSNFVTH